MKATRTTFWLATMAGLLIAGNAYAATFAVDSLGAESDAAPGDGVCSSALGECTLDAALDEVIADPGSAHTIDLSGVSGTILVFGSISLNSAVTIVGNGTVTLDGQSTYAFEVNASNTTISGLGFANFARIRSRAPGFTFDSNVIAGGSGLLSEAPGATITNNNIYATLTTAAINAINADGSVIAGNTTGIDESGALDNGSSLVGLYLQKSSNMDISGNTSGGFLSGILMASVTDSMIYKNRTGDFDGSVGFGSSRHGIWVISSTNCVFDSNMSNGNTQNGIYFNASSSNSVFNHIAEGNGGSGVLLDNSIAHIQGSLLTNNAAGITAPGHGSTFASNSIIDNAGLGIDLGAAGVTANSSADIFTNFPTLAGATGGAAVSIDGTHTGAPNTMFELEFFASDSCDASGNGEGARSVGTVSVTTDATGDAPFAASFSTAVAAGKFISATATGPNGTSEFSGCAEALPGADPEIDVDFYKLNSWTFNKRSMKPLIGVFFGSDDLDVDDITVGSLRLGTAPPCIIIYVDLNLDGHKDLVVGFLGRFTGASCGDSELELSGEAGAATFSEILGIRVVGCRGN